LTDEKDAGDTAHSLYGKTGGFATEDTQRTEKNRKKSLLRQGRRDAANRDKSSIVISSGAKRSRETRFWL
jgi:hypothetical protein